MISLSHPNPKTEMILFFSNRVTKGGFSTFFKNVQAILKTDISLFGSIK